MIERQFRAPDLSRRFRASRRRCGEGVERSGRQHRGRREGKVERDNGRAVELVEVKACLFRIAVGEDLVALGHTSVVPIWVTCARYVCRGPFFYLEYFGCIISCVYGILVEAWV